MRFWAHVTYDYYYLSTVLKRTICFANFFFRSQPVEERGQWLTFKRQRWRWTVWPRCRTPKTFDPKARWRQWLKTNSSLPLIYLNLVHFIYVYICHHVTFLTLNWSAVNLLVFYKWVNFRRMFSPVHKLDLLK